MLKHRMATGFSVAGFFLAVLVFGPFWALLGLLAAVYVLAQTEYKEMVEAGGHGLGFAGMMACGGLYLAATVTETVAMRTRFPVLEFAGHPVALSELVLWLAPAVLLVLEVLRRKPERSMERFGLGLVGFWYVAVLLSFMLRLGFGWPLQHAGGATDYTGRLVLVYFIWVVKLGDVGAYAVGMLWGRKTPRLIPEISPAKSVAGLGGAYLGATLASLVVAWAAHQLGDGALGTMRLPWGHALGLGVLLATVGVVGDLGESLMKRSLGVKDSSGRFPGMGGFLDMMDSLLFSAPFMYLYLRWFLS